MRLVFDTDARHTYFQFFWLALLYGDGPEAPGLKLHFALAGNPAADGVGLVPRSPESQVELSDDEAALLARKMLSTRWAPRVTPVVFDAAAWLRDPRPASPRLVAWS